jgi:hypothetical protein
MPLLQVCVCVLRVYGAVLRADGTWHADGARVGDVCVTHVTLPSKVKLWDPKL